MKEIKYNTFKEFEEAQKRLGVETKDLLADQNADSMQVYFVKNNEEHSYTEKDIVQNISTEDLLKQASKRIGVNLENTKQGE